jgi:putative peptidoglycan lipid II flippase
MLTAQPVAARRDRHRHRCGAAARTLARARAATPEEALHLQNRSLEFGLAITVPAAVALALLPEPIIALVFERGAFTRETTLVTSSVLAAFAIGLPAFVLTKIFTPAFYAREDMRTPLWASSISVVVNIAGSLFLFPRLGVMGLAIATSLAGWLSALYLGQQLVMRDLFRPADVTLRRIWLIVAGAALMGVLLWWAEASFPHLLLDGFAAGPPAFGSDNRFRQCRGLFRVCLSHRSP